MDVVARYKEKRKKRLDQRAIEEYRIRRNTRMDMRLDDEEEGNNGGNHGGGHGNTRLPYGLCQSYGIEIGKDWTPSDAWNALAEKGVTPSGTYARLKKERAERSGKVKKESFTRESASEYLGKVKDQEKQRKHDIDVTQNDLNIVKANRSSTGKACENLTNEIHRMEANLKSGAYSESSTGRIQSLIDASKERLTRYQEDFEEAKKSERELEDKLSKLKAGIDSSEKDRIKEALKAKFPNDWESCESADDVVEMANMLGIADESQSKVASVVEYINSWYKPKYMKPAKMDGEFGSDEIVQKLAGGDETSGSCATLCVAYIANKMGYDVLDFRGGDSQKAFSSQCRTIMRDLGGDVEADRDGYKAAHKNLAKVEEGKEYWFESGSHAAMVRKKDGRIEYLEMQSSGPNGWYPLTDRVLKSRFGTHHTRTSYGHRFDLSSHLIDVDKVMGSPVFPALFGFLNTAKEKQKKGESGYAK